MILFTLYILSKIIRKLPGMIIHRIPLPKPTVLEGFQTRNQIGDICQNAGYQRVVIITDDTLFRIGFHSAVQDSLEKHGIACSIFHDIASEPTPAVVEAARKLVLAEEAQCIIALGGGSVLDASKMVAASARMPKRSVKSMMVKFLFMKKQTLPIISVPSTAGTGAESTVGTVMTSAKGKKCATVIVGLNVTNVVLDCELSMRAPRSVTAACGIDALSHGLEGCVADVKSSPSDVEKSMECVRLVMENLPKVMENPDDIPARQAMCKAAFLGGNAINKQLAGYVHAVAHSIGAHYHIAHGKAIALSLLPVMRFQQPSCLPKLRDVSVYCGLADATDSPSAAADKLLAALEQLLEKCGLTGSEKIVSPADYPQLALMIFLDSINYSAPIVMRRREIISIL